MKKALLIFILMVFASQAYPQDVPKDVPEDHYAYEALQDLADRGVDLTQGYPDGTFRGTKYTSKYEIAYFMSALAENLRGPEELRIDVDDVKAEIEYVRNELKSLNDSPDTRRDFNYYGSVELKNKYGSVTAYDPKNNRKFGPETNYRLKYSVEKRLGPDATLKLNLDTIDAGYNTASDRDLPMKLMDIEGSFVANIGLENPVVIKAITGPGTIMHRDLSGVAPSEDNTVISRPRPSFIMATVIGGYDVVTGYAARGVSAFGVAGTSEANFTVGKNLGQIGSLGTSEISTTSRYVFTDVMNPTYGPNNFHQELVLTADQGKAYERLMVAASAAEHPQSQFYLNFELYLKDITQNSTDLSLKFNSVGVDYRLPFEALEFVSNNLFNRRILNGNMDIGIEIVQPISKTTMLKSRSEWMADHNGKMGTDIRGSSFTSELSLDHKLTKNLSMNTFYRYYLVPSRIDQFGTPVPEVSDLIGISLMYKF